MGLFDLFRKKQTALNQAENNAYRPVNTNAYIIEVLKAKLILAGYKVERHPQYLTLIVNSELEISAAVFDTPGAHPYVIQVMFLTAHPLHFPKGIVENLAGIGETPEKRVEAAVDNYLTTIYQTVMDGFTDTHDPGFDFPENEVLWHPKLGNLSTQGQWENLPQEDHLYKIIKEKFKPMLTADKFNWLKIYVSKSAAGNVIGECVFNNQLWPEGTEAILADANLWQVKGEFMALKQFIMFRRCDKYDPLPPV